MLRRGLVLTAIAACSPGPTATPAHRTTAPDAVPLASSVWSSVVGRASERPRAGPWLTARDGEPVLALLGSDGVRFEDAEGRRLAAIATPGIDSAALDTSRAIVFLGGSRRIAAIDLLDDVPRVAVLSQALTHEGYAVQLGRAPVIAPELLVGLDALDDPGTSFALLDWSGTRPALVEVAVDSDGAPTIGRPLARWDPRWLAARAQRVEWQPVDRVLSGVHPRCPQPHGDLDCQPFGAGSLWLVATHEEMGDVLHVDVALYDAARKRWATPRDDVAPPGLQWQERETKGVEFSAVFDRTGRVYTTATHVCRIDAGCRRLDGEALGFLGGNVRVGAEG